MIYLLAGHTVVNGKGTGAFGVNGFDEAVEALRLRDDLTAALRAKGVKVVNEVNDSPLAKVVAWLRSLVKAEDTVIEIHFNAGPETASGVETLIDDTPTQQERLRAQALSLCVSTALKIPMRGKVGVKLESESQHSSLAIISVPSVAVNLLLEVCFCSNQMDLLKYRKNYEQLVTNLANVIA